MRKVPQSKDLHFNAIFVTQNRWVKLMWETFAIVENGAKRTNVWHRIDDCLVSMWVGYHFNSFPVDGFVDRDPFALVRQPQVEVVAE